MKVAFHFNAALPAFGNPFGPAIEELLFSKLLSNRNLHVSTKVYVGDFPLALLSQDQEEFARVINRWLLESQNGWRRFTKRMDQIARTDVWVWCFESVGQGFAGALHKDLSREEGYLGAIEVNDACRLHWEIYSDVLGLRYRLVDDSIAVFYDGMTSQEPTLEEKDFDVKRLLDVGFKAVNFESAPGKHSIFDKYHNFSQARRVAEWKTRFSDLLGFMADEVVCRLGDTAPELGNKLWFALDTFERAETDEQYAQVSATCRRIIEYVVDTIFPPTKETRDGRDLGEGKYRNRLLAWVEDQTKSGATIDLISSNLGLFAQHVEKLQDLASKGVHSNLQRDGARRCLLRTVFLLDDIVALRPESFPIKPELDFSILETPKTGNEKSPEPPEPPPGR